MNYRIIICAYSGIFDLSPSNSGALDPRTLDFISAAVQRIGMLLREAHWSESLVLVTDHPSIAKHMEQQGYRATLTPPPPPTPPASQPAATPTDVGALLAAAAHNAHLEPHWADSDALIVVDPTLMLVQAQHLASAHAMLTKSLTSWVTLGPTQITGVSLLHTDTRRDQPQRAIAGTRPSPFGFFAITVGQVRHQSTAPPHDAFSLLDNTKLQGTVLPLGRAESYRITSAQEAIHVSRGIESLLPSTMKMVEEDALARQLLAVGKKAQDVRLLIFDFDGVMTDNRVLVMQDGTEGATCNRSDGLGIGLLKEGIATNGWNLSMMVMSKEKNPVVGKRCEKLKLECRQGIDDKLSELHRVLQERGITLEQVAYVGNDINDLACMRVVGLPIAVGDAYPPILAVAKGVTTKLGGHGAVREVCDWFIASLRGR